VRQDCSGAVKGSGGARQALVQGKNQGDNCGRAKLLARTCSHSACGRWQ